MIARALTLVLAFVAGAGIGFVLTFTHRQYIVAVGDVDLPFGLTGGLLIVAGMLAGIRLAFGDRLATLIAAVGLVLATMALLVPARGGSPLTLEDPISFAWAIGPTVIAAVVVAWPGRRSHGHPAREV